MHISYLLKDNNLSFGFYLNKIDEKKYSNDQNVKASYSRCKSLKYFLYSFIPSSYPCL